MSQQQSKQSNTSLSKGIAFIFKYLGKHWFALIFVLIFIIIATYLQVKAPLIMGDAINEMVKYVMSASNPQVEADISDFVFQIGKLILAYVLISVGMFMYGIIMNSVATKSGKRIRSSLFDKLQKLSIRFFDESNDGDILSRFTNDIDNIGNFLNQTFVQILSSVILIISIAYTMLMENVQLGIIVIVLAIICVFSLSFFARKASFYVGLQQKNLGSLNGYIDEKINGQKLIITAGLEDETYESFVPFNEAYRESSKKGQAFSNVLFPLVNGFMLVTLAAIIFFGADLIVAGTLSIGLLIAFIQYVQRFFQPLTQIVSQYNEFRLAITGSSRVSEIIEQPEDVVNSVDATPYTPIQKEVRLENVTFGYKPEVDVLKNVSITVEQGKKVALVGPTGSGKTTIMNLLNRFYDINEGAIYFDDREIKKIELDSLRENVGIVLQDSVLFTGTIRDNICFGKRDASQEEIEAAAKAANIHDFIVNLKDGYDTLVGDNNSVFSVGQKQLISIARTILTNPDLLILDEATSNVDTVTEQQIQQAMNNILHDRTSFVIAHRLKTILDADKIVVLVNGEVIEQGNHEDLMKLNGFYADLYNNQFVLEG